jgi:hypothetical protein
LEWIPMMAMRKERERRYPSPLALSADIGRYLSGLPLTAGPESGAYRLRKFVGRHRTALLAATAALLLLAGGTSAYVRGIRAEQAKTERALAETDKQKHVADQQRDAARESAAAARRRLIDIYLRRSFRRPPLVCKGVRSLRDAGRAGRCPYPFRDDAGCRSPLAGHGRGSRGPARCAVRRKGGSLEWERSRNR